MYIVLLRKYIGIYFHVFLMGRYRTHAGNLMAYTFASIHYTQLGNAAIVERIGSLYIMNSGEGTKHESVL